MVLYKVYSQDHRIHYFAHPCSSAVFFQLSCLLLTFLPPLFISYFTSGFYYKELTYSEQPHISFHNKYELIIGSASSLIFSSSDARLNNYFTSNYYSTTLRTATPRDIDGDSIIDQHTIALSLISSGLNIQDSTVNLWLIFQYQLNQYSAISMETLGLISLKAPPTLSANTNVTIYGQLNFQQRDPVSNHPDISSIPSSIINYGTYSLVPPFDEILNNYTSRNYFTTFEQNYVQWSPAGTDDPQLTITVILNTSLQSIRYVPSFWKEFRWAWIQYVTILLPFLYVMNKVKEFVFSNRLVRTIVKQSS